MPRCLGAGMQGCRGAGMQGCRDAEVPGRGEINKANRK